MAYYTAITIGPISDTMQLTSTPGGTWCASYLFSWIAKNLIGELVRTGSVPAEDFASPVFDVDDNGEITIAAHTDMMSQGIGMFHDHIIFRGSSLPAAESAIRAGKAQVAELLKTVLGKDYSAWVQDYLRLYAVVRDVPDGTGPIVAFGDILSAMELEPAFPAEEEENPLLTLFEGSTGENRSRLLKKVLEPFGLTEAKWLLTDPDRGNQILNLEHLAHRSGGKDARWKSEQYYCVLYSDGDSMGKMYQTLDSVKEIRAASEKCLNFCAEGAKMIRQFGGLPVYAGGDDLLALLPVTGPVNGRDGTVIGLTSALNQKFNELFAAEREALHGAPSLSVGIAIRHYKSPLYEALERARELLTQAKKGTEKKNGLRIDLQKHSGQSLLFSVDGMTESALPEKLEKLILDARGSRRGQEDVSMFLSGAGYVLENFDTLFQTAIRHYIDAGCSGDTLKHFFDNMFDSDAQAAYGEYLDSLRGYFETAIRESRTPDPEVLKQRCCFAVRLLRFLLERKERD